MLNINLKEHLILIGDTIIIGIIGAVCAEFFILLLDAISKFAMGDIVKYIPPDVINILHVDSNNHIKPYILLLVISIGGLISGILVYTFAPEAEGHGTDSVIRAFHRTGGYLRPIVTPIKIISSAITIGTGGSAGREGPTALFSAGIGSFYSSIKNSSLKKRRLYTLIAMAAGLSAVFKSPLGTAFFAVEVLYDKGEFKIDELVVILFGSLIAFVLTSFFFGWNPIFSIPSNLTTDNITFYIKMIIVGIFSGFISIVIPNIFYFIRDMFRNIKIKPHFKPMIGAFITGVIAINFPAVLGGGYGWIQNAIDGEVYWKLAIILIVFKLLAFSFTIGSGGSGGVFAPTLFIGAMSGVLFSSILHENTSILAIISMATIFGAAARTPLASVLMVTEMTGGYSLLAPTILAMFFANTSHMFLSKLLKVKYTSLYEAQLININYSPFEQVKKIRDILYCYSGIIKIDPDEISDEKLLELIEKGKPLEIKNNYALFFGTSTKDISLTNEKENKKFNNLYILYIFRDGKWYHLNKVDTINKNDGVLLYGTLDDVRKTSSYFVRHSKIFSKLMKQHKNLEEEMKEKIPLK